MPHITTVHGKSVRISVKDPFAARDQIEEVAAVKALAERIRAAGLEVNIDPQGQAESILIYIGKPAAESIEKEWRECSLESLSTEGPAPAEVIPFFGELQSIMETLGLRSIETWEGVVALKVGAKVNP